MELFFLLLYWAGLVSKRLTSRFVFIAGQALSSRRFTSRFVFHETIGRPQVSRVMALMELFSPFLHGEQSLYFLINGKGRD